MSIIKRIWNRICELVTRERLAKVWKILFDGAVTVTVSILTNEALMNAALDISLSLMGLKTDKNMKKAEFDMKMFDWCERNGVDELSEADMNLVREIAYAAARKSASTAG